MANVLVVDDEPLIRDELRKLLEGIGLSVSIAANGREAVKLLDRAPLELVVTDILLPDLDGIEIIREIRSREAQSKIIAISGGGAGDYTNYLRWAQMLGADRVFEKPINAVDLLHAVLSLLRGEAATQD